MQKNKNISWILKQVQDDNRKTLRGVLLNLASAILINSNKFIHTCIYKYISDPISMWVNHPRHPKLISAFIPTLKFQACQPELVPASISYIAPITCHPELVSGSIVKVYYSVRHPELVSGSMTSFRAIRISNPQSLVNGAGLQ